MKVLFATLAVLFIISSQAHAALKTEAVDYKEGKTDLEGF